MYFQHFCRKYLLVAFCVLGLCSIVHADVFENARQGDAKAQFELGMRYAANELDGVEGRNDLEAIHWLTLAAQQGYAPAQSNLGYSYQYGLGVDMNLEKALEWYLKAAEQGYVPAQNYLGYLVYSGAFPTAHNPDSDFEEVEERAMRWFLKTAEQGYAPAQNNIGYLYAAALSAEQLDYLVLQIDRRLRFEQDYDKALYWFDKAAEQGLPSALYNMGIMYGYGLGVQQDDAKAMHYYLMAAQPTPVSTQDTRIFSLYDDVGMSFIPAPEQDDGQIPRAHAIWFLSALEQGHAGAQSNIGHLYLNGNGVNREEAIAMQWYYKAAVQNYEEACWALGHMYNEGLGLEKPDYGTGRQWQGIARTIHQTDWQGLAHRGNAQAQYEFGMALWYERDPTPNAQNTLIMLEAIKWLTLAAKQGNIDAQNQLGYMYAYSEDVVQDYAMALFWYGKAAEQGDRASQLELGNMYQYGHGVTPDYAIAMQYYLQASEEQEIKSITAAAQVAIGKMYQEGLGVTQDYEVAKQWYLKTENNPSSQYQLGMLYEQGLGVEQNTVTAFEHYLAAAQDQFFSAAQFKVGVMYLEGLGVEHNLEEGVSWLRNAARREHTEANRL